MCDSIFSRGEPSRGEPFWKSIDYWKYLLNKHAFNNEIEESLHRLEKIDYKFNEIDREIRYNNSQLVAHNNVVSSYNGPL